MTQFATAIENINPLFAASAELPPVVDGLTTNEAPAPTEPAPVEAGVAPAPEVVKVKLPQDEQLAADIAAIDEQIAVLTKRREGKAQLLANLDKLASITEGTILTVTQGRAETTRQVTGVVVAIADGRYKLSVGEGFDATYIVVTAPQIVTVGA